MLTVRNIRVSTLSRDSVTVSWTIEETPEDLSGYTLTLLRSGSEVGPYSVVSPAMSAEDISEYHDREVNLVSKWRELYYRVRVTKVSDGETQEWGSVDPERVLQGSNPLGVPLESAPDLEALEARRRFALTAREFGGRAVLALNRRTWGQRCPVCWDTLKRRRTKSGCLSCFDTGFTGGYFLPQETWCMKMPGQEAVQPTPYFELQVNDVVMQFGAHPRLSPRDLIVDAAKSRWRVLNVRRHEKGWALTRQTVHLREVPRSDIEYRLPLTGWSRDTFTSAPSRQHIRATDIDSFFTAVGAKGLTGESYNDVRDFRTRRAGE